MRELVFYLRKSIPSRCVQAFTMLGAVLLFAGAVSAAETNAPETLTLAQAHVLALKNHPQLAAANYRALAAEQVATETRSGLFPEVNLFGNVVGAANSGKTQILGGGQDIPGLFVSPSIYNHVATGLSIKQLVTDFGYTTNLVASSKLQAQAENRNVAATREQVLLQVDTNYFDVLKAQAVLTVARQTLATRTLLLNQVSLLANNKLKSELDVSFAHAAVDRARLLVQRAKNGADAALASLSKALGLSKTQPFQLVEQPLPVATTTNDIAILTQMALRDRPELASLRDRRESARRLALAERDAVFPRISAVAAVGDSPIHDHRLPNNFAVAGIQLSVPIFAGGRYTAREHEADLRAKSDEELLRVAVDNIVRDVRVAWLNLNTAEEQFHTAQDLVQTANESYELANARYKVGSSSIVALSQAQLELTSAQIAEANAHYDVLIRKANLNYQIGGMSG